MATYTITLESCNPPSGLPDGTNQTSSDGTKPRSLAYGDRVALQLTGDSSSYASNSAGSFSLSGSATVFTVWGASVAAGDLVLEGGKFFLVDDGKPSCVKTLTYEKTSGSAFAFGGSSDRQRAMYFQSAAAAADGIVRYGSSVAMYAGTIGSSGLPVVQNGDVLAVGGTGTAFTIQNANGDVPTSDAPASTIVLDNESGTDLYYSVVTTGATCDTDTWPTPTLFTDSVTVDMPASTTADNQVTIGVFSDANAGSTPVATVCSPGANMPLLTDTAGISASQEGGPGATLKKLAYSRAARILIMLLMGVAAVLAVAGVGLYLNR